MPHDRRDDRQSGGGRGAQLARHQFALQLDTGDEEEDREQPVRRPVLHRQVQAAAPPVRSGNREPSRSCRAPGCSPSTSATTAATSSSTPPTVSARSASATKFRSGSGMRPRNTADGARGCVTGARPPVAAGDHDDALRPTSVSPRACRDAARSVAPAGARTAEGRPAVAGCPASAPAVRLVRVSPREAAEGSLVWMRSMTVESVSVVTSPSSRFSATSRSRRRMILPERVLGSSATIRIRLGLAIGPSVLATWLRSSAIELVAVVGGGAAQDDEGDDGLAGGRVGGADDGGLGDLRVGDEGGLDLGGGDVVAGDEHDVVDAAEQPDVAVVVLLGAVAGEVAAGEAGPVGVEVALVVAPDGAQHRRPRLGEDQVAAGAVGDLVGLVVDDGGGDAGQGASGRSRAWSR